MARRGRFLDLRVEERHSLSFEFGDHERSRIELSELDVRLRCVADAHKYLPLRTIELLDNAAKDDGVIRLGVMGFTLSPENEGPQLTISKLISSPTSLPLHRSADDIWCTWAIDLPPEIKSVMSEATKLDEEAVLIWQMRQPIENELYPITLRTNLVLLDDELVLQVQKDAQRQDRLLNAIETAQRLEQASGERNVFGIAFSFSGTSLRKSARLTAFEIERPGDSSGGDFQLEGPDDEIHFGILDTRSNRIVFFQDSSNARSMNMDTHD